MRGIIVVLLMGLCEMAFSQTPAPQQPDQSRYISLAAVSVAKRICTDKPSASVWIYRKADGWIEADCPQLTGLGIFDPDLGDFIDQYVNMEKLATLLNGKDVKISGHKAKK